MKLDTILKLVLFFLISLTLHFALVSADSLSSDSQNISEWRMDGRTLNGTRFYPGPIPSDLSQLRVITNATGDFTGDPTIADGFMYGISLRDRVYKRNASNITILMDRTADHTLFQYPVQPLWNGFVYGGDEFGNIYQYNTSNLSQVIATNSEPVPQHYSSPIIYKGFIYFTDWWSTSGPIFQANASNVTQVIARFYVSNCQAAPVIQNDFLYYGCGTRIYQLNATNITKSIANYTAGGSFSTASGLAVTDSYLYFGTSDDKLYQLNASNITIFVANYTTGNNINIPPAVGHGFVYIGSTDGYTYQLNASNVSHQIANYSTGSVPEGLTVTSDYLLASGSKLYQLNALNISQQISNYSVSSSGSPVVANGIIYFSSGVSFYQLGTDIPIVTLNSPAAGYQLSQSTEAVTFNCTALDNSGLVNISLYLTDSGNTNFLLNQTTNISGAGNTTAWTLNLVRGNYTWNCLAYDTDGNNAFSTNRTISEDKSAPSLSISSPVNNSYSSNTTLKIIYTASDSYLSTCWFSNDSMLVNTTIAECASIADVTWSEGQHNLTLWANDTSGNMNSTTRRFSIDTIIPSIDITVPTNNTNSTNNRQNINATKSDLNRASCWYSNDSMLVNTTLASCANVTTVTWSEGQHNVTMWVNDSAGNKNSSLVSFYLDSKSPALNVTYPINNTNWTNNLLMVNYTSSDINLQSCWYNNDSMLVNTTLTGCANITAV
ncbi:hypothetical protein HYT52_00950, partial [Candidatus Woesearchaeota archaeon]|nr:hypothetical protein [Candidatus Woesearchaeota archaeon]